MVNFGCSKPPLKGFQPRKTTIFKSARELSVLCGVDVALIMYDHGNTNPEVWCSKPGSIDTIINRAYGKTIVPLNPAQDVSQLGVQGLNEFAGFLAGKLEQVNERINLLKSCCNDEKKSTDLIIHREGLNDNDDWIDMIDFSTDGLELDFLCHEIGVDDGNGNAIGFCEGGVDDDNVDEAKTSDYEFEWFNQLMSYNGDDLASLYSLISC